MKLERIIWTIILILAGLFLAWRILTGEIGRVYVKQTANDLIVVPPDADEDGIVDIYDSKVYTPESIVSHNAALNSAEGGPDAGTPLVLPPVGDPNRFQWNTYAEASATDYWKAVKADANQSEYSLSVSRTIGLWLAALFTLAIFSFLYRDNPFYKTAECIVVGVSAAYGMVVGFWEVIIPNLISRLLPALVKGWATPGIEPDLEIWYIIPLILGIMLLMRLSPKGAWISRWPLAFIIGTTAGFRMISFIHADFLSQIRNGIKPLFVPQYESVTGPGGEQVQQMVASATFWASMENLILLIGVLSCLVYFFFSIEHKGLVGKTAKLGIWFLMVTFGAAFGYTVMGRIALLAIRIEFLFDDWLWLIDPKDLHTLTNAATGGG